MRMIRIGEDESVSDSAIASVEIESRHYANGSDHYLVVKLLTGEVIRKQHGWGFDAFETKRKIEEAMSDG